jgi:hypothetical protein
MNTKERWKRYPGEVGVAFDQFLNAIIPPFWTLSYADETMSARLYRGYAKRRIVGRLVMPPVDAFFAIWQGPDEEVNEAAGRVIYGHCERAYWKEKLRRNNHPEYRDE